MQDLGGTGKGIAATPSSSTTTQQNPDGTITTSTTTLDITVCGVPGKPACKIDESGTPTDKELKLDEAGLLNTAKGNRDAAAGTSDKSGIFSGWSGLFVTPPVVACAPLTFTMSGGVEQTVDPCPVVSGVRAFMAWLWALAAFWICLAWIREAN
jgi:hypothetical protein